MKLKFVRRLSVHPSVASIISEVVAGISFKFFWLLLFFLDFLRIFFVFGNMGLYGSENFKTLLLLQIVAESFETFPEFSSQWSSQNRVWDF